jgi:NAD+ kinase
MREVGVVVNPIAGMGGRVGLKGTDGKVAEARDRGAERRAPDRAREALAALAEADPDVVVATYGGPMGETAAREAGLDPVVVGEPEDSGATTATDTRAAVRALADRGVDLVLFVGGDGTAADVAEALAAGAGSVDGTGAADGTDEVPMLGVPAGVKVYSSVFAVSPRAAGEMAATFDRTERAEVNDVDEDAFRGGEVRTELRAVARVPVDDRRQNAKERAGGSVAGLAAAVAGEVRPDRTYVLGTGGTVDAVAEALGVEGTTLGVDVYRDGELVAADVGESGILAALGEDNVAIVSPIGGQGFLFGRGNQQLSPAVLDRCEIEVVASRRKLDDLGVLRVDTGDPETDERLRGWRRVRVGAVERRLIEVV